MKTKKPIYKTWLRKKILFILTSLFILIIFVISTNQNQYLNILLSVISVICLYILIILFLTYYHFSDFGGQYQSRIHNLISNKITKKGSLLEIGTGSGSLINKCAKRNLFDKLIGIDFWGKDWEYSKELCEENSRLEGNENIEFIKASAANLPFEDNTFDVVVSCLTFHEVKDERDKQKLILEALRVLKPGGEFIFLDLFLDKSILGIMKF